MAFATVGQLATRLGRTFTSSETGQAAAVLDDATAYLQSVIGQKVEAGSMTVDLSVEPTAQKVRLPQWPVQSVTSVELNGDAISDYEVRDGHIVRTSGFPAESGNAFSTLTVEYDYGLDEIPGELVTYTCVLAAGALAQVARGGSLGASGVSSERIDDYAVNYDTTTTTFQLPERILDKLRASYGAGADVTGSW